MSNKLKARLSAGKAAVNAWLAIPSGFSAEVMAQCGWDSVTVDIQHGVQDYQSMVQCFQAMQAIGQKLRHRALARRRIQRAAQQQQIRPGFPLGSGAAQ